MKIVKRLLLAIVILIAAGLIAALFIDKKMDVTKDIVINKPKADVFNYIRLLKNQNNYSKWAKMDPAMKVTFTGTDATPGFVSAWEGNSDVGKGEQTITKITEGESLETQIHFIKPFEAMADGKMTTEALSDNTTKVTWSFKSEMTYPFNLMKLFSDPEKSVGNDLTTGLTNLKTILEK